MLPSREDNEQPSSAHVIYDKVTGRVLGRYREIHLDQEAAQENAAAPEQILDLFGQDESVMARVTEGDPGNLDLMQVDAAEPVNRMHVAEKRNKLVPMPRLRLRSDREVLQGDGTDAVAITIDVIDERDRVMRKYNGTVLVTTTRGKLSTRGGRTEIQEGQGELTLTSVPETVERVSVRVRAPDSSALADEIILSFE